MRSGSPERGAEPAGPVACTSPPASVQAEGGAFVPDPALNPAANTTSQPATDRRQDDRREQRADRALSRLATPPSADQWFPRRWNMLILAMMIACAANYVATRALPGPWSTLSLAGAIIAACLVGPAHRRLGARAGSLRMLGAACVVVAPLFLFGLGITRWGLEARLPGEQLLASLAGVGLIAMLYLRRQPVMVYAAQLGLWWAAALALASPLAPIGLVLASALGYIVTRQQLGEQLREDYHRFAQERIQTRARDILADYENTGQGWFWETDRRALLTYVSDPVARALGCNSEFMIGHPLVELFDLAGIDEVNERALMFHLTTRSAFKELALRAATVDDERWWSISGRPIYDRQNNFVGFRGSGTDLTERKRSQDEASRLANFDSLTGLANRFQILQSIEKILRSRQKSNRACAIFLLDLDRFKQVNDTMGHPAGDALLQQVARRIERAVGHKGRVGRLGGDEFKVIVHGGQGRDTLENLARDIIQSISQPFEIDGQRVVIGASIGIAIAPDDGETSEELIRNADLALYAAKDGGRGRFHFYSADLHAEVEARAQLEDDLRYAMAHGQLQMHYQPVVSTATERITGFEALLRWHHPTKGWIEPARFIQAAEDTGMITQLGEWALRTACHDMAGMPAEVRVAVNVSALQFANPQLPAVLTSAIAQAGIAPDKLELEITESVFLSDDANTDAMFSALKGIGVRLALDDFGTGYSSLGYLRHAPFDKIKIDQSFVRGATEEGSRNGAIIASITSLAQALGMETTAEGVETLDELELVRVLGCSHVQGFIYERPLDADAARARVESGLALVANGPSSSRARRSTLLRKAVIEFDGSRYNATIRNISTSGALVEGLWNVPADSTLKITFGAECAVTCKVRWCEGDRMGVEFVRPLERDAGGAILAVQGPSPSPVGPEIPGEEKGRALIGSLA